MKYLYYIVVILSSLLYLLIYFLLMNPNDLQYKSFEKEMIARKAFQTGDIDTYLEYADNPVSIKYHAGSNMILSKVYTKLGRYNDAERVTKSFKRDYDYSFCKFMKKPSTRFFCRANVTLTGSAFKLDKSKILAEIYFEQGEYEKSLAEMIRKWESFPCIQAKIFADRGDMVSAYEALKACKSKANLKREFLLTKGFVFQKDKKYLKAKALYEKSINRHCLLAPYCKANNSSFIALGNLYADMHNYGRAIYYYKKVLKNEPYNYKANYYTAMCYLKMRQNYSALIYFNRVMQLKPDNADEINKIIGKLIK